MIRSRNRQPPYLRPAIPITLALLVGILLGQRFSGHGPVAGVIFAAALVQLIICVKRERSAKWSPLLATLAAGYLAMVPWCTPSYGPDHIVRFIDTGYWRIEGIVIEQPVLRHGRTRTILDVEALSRKDQVKPVRGRIRLTIMGEVILHPGDRVRFPARIRSFRNFKNPGGFDYRRYMAFKGIHGSAWVRMEKLKRDIPLTAFGIGSTMNRFRNRLGHLVDEAGGDRFADEKAVLRALVYGDRTGIHPSLRQRFNRSGVGHLLAISGLHVGIVATLAFGCFHFLFAFIPALLWRGWVRKWAAAATLLPVLGYGMLAGMSPSTQRAEIMVAVFLAAMIFGQGHDLMNTLSVAALIILALFPPSLFTISFQLSFAAVLTIVYGMGKIGINRRENAGQVEKAGKRLFDFTLVSALAIAGTTPLILFHFHQTSMVGIVANLFLVPLVGFVAVPIGLVASFLSIVSDFLAVAGFRLGLMVLKGAMILLDHFATWPFAAIKTIIPSPMEIGLYYAAAWSLLNIKGNRTARWALAAVLIFVLADGLYWSHRRFWHRDLVVTAIDVGQGGATLLEIPGGRVLLYDGGGFSDNRIFDIGRQVVAPMLWRRKIATVDTLILSHPNADHLNGLIFIAKNFHVRELWTNGDASDTMGYDALMAACVQNGILVRQLNDDIPPMELGPVTLSVLSPPAGYFDFRQNNEQHRCNDGSLVMKATFGMTAFLLTGDITSSMEERLVNDRRDDLPSTVLFAPHHGSKTSSAPEFVDAVRPRWVIISAGAGNRFGFPHQTVMTRYRKQGANILCTALHGAIIMKSDGDAIRFNWFAEPNARPRDHN